LSKDRQLARYLKEKKPRKRGCGDVDGMACALQASIIYRAKKAGVPVHSSIRRDILALRR
jgi:hypothetical protein